MSHSFDIFDDYNELVNSYRYPNTNEMEEYTAQQHLYCKDILYKFYNEYVNTSFDESFSKLYVITSYIRSEKYCIINYDEIFNNLSHEISTLLSSILLVYSYNVIPNKQLEYISAEDKWVNIVNDNYATHSIPIDKLYKDLIFAKEIHTDLKCIKCRPLLSSFYQYKGFNLKTLLIDLFEKHNTFKFITDYIPFIDLVNLLYYFRNTKCRIGIVIYKYLSYFALHIVPTANYYLIHKNIHTVNNIISDRSYNTIDIKFYSIINYFHKLNPENLWFDYDLTYFDNIHDYDFGKILILLYNSYLNDKFGKIINHILDINSKLYKPKSVAILHNYLCNKKNKTDHNIQSIAILFSKLLKQDNYCINFMKNLLQYNYSIFKNALLDDRGNSLYINKKLSGHYGIAFYQVERIRPNKNNFTIRTIDFMNPKIYNKILSWFSLSQEHITEYVKLYLNKLPDWFIHDLLVVTSKFQLGITKVLMLIRLIDTDFYKKNQILFK